MLFSAVILCKSKMHFVSASLGINTSWGLLHSWVQLADQVVSLAFLSKAFILKFQDFTQLSLVSCFPIPRKVGICAHEGRSLKKLGPIPLYSF